MASNITHSPVRSNVITSPVEFSTGKFRAKNVWKVFFNMAQPISKKNKGHFRKSIEKKKARLKDASVLFALEVIVQFELSMPNSENTYGVKEIFSNKIQECKLLSKRCLLSGHVDRCVQ